MCATVHSFLMLRQVIHIVTAGLIIVNEISFDILFHIVNIGCNKNACGVAAL